MPAANRRSNLRQMLLSLFAAFRVLCDENRTQRPPLSLRDEIRLSKGLLSPQEGQPLRALIVPAEQAANATRAELASATLLL